MKSFYLGMVAVGVVLGLMIGLSSTPVVGIVVPLIFALITAGGGLYVVRGTADAQRSGEKTNLERAKLLGGQLGAFAIGALLGLYGGIYAKLHSNSVWFSGRETNPAFQHVKPRDIRLVTALIRVDADLIAAGLSENERGTIFQYLEQSLQRRAQLPKDYGIQWMALAKELNQKLTVHNESVKKTDEALAALETKLPGSSELADIRLLLSTLKESVRHLDVTRNNMSIFVTNLTKDSDPDLDLHKADKEAAEQILKISKVKPPEMSILAELQGPPSETTW